MWVVCFNSPDSGQSRCCGPTWRFEVPGQEAADLADGGLTRVGGGRRAINACAQGLSSGTPRTRASFEVFHSDLIEDGGRTREPKVLSSFPARHEDEEISHLTVAGSIDVLCPVHEASAPRGS